MQHRAVGRQAQAPLGESRRWNFAEMQKLKKNVISESVDEPHKPTEIFVMLPLDIIAVGELFEGQRHGPLHPHTAAPHWRCQGLPLESPESSMHAWHAHATSMHAVHTVASQQAV